jgi:hypothetical protein
MAARMENLIFVLVLSSITIFSLGYIYFYNLLDLHKKIKYSQDIVRWIMNSKFKSKVNLKMDQLKSKRRRIICNERNLYEKS